MQGIVYPTLLVLVYLILFRLIPSIDIGSGLFLECSYQSKHPVIHTILYPVLLDKLLQFLMQSLPLLPKGFYLCTYGEANWVIAAGHKGIADAVSAEQTCTVA